MDNRMEGADVDGLERAGKKCLAGAELAESVMQVLEGIVAALSAAAFFAGPWVAPIIAFLTTKVIPWLRNVVTALRSFGNVLNGRAAAQRSISNGLAGGLSRLPAYTPLGAGSPAFTELNVAKESPPSPTRSATGTAGRASPGGGFSFTGSPAGRTVSTDPAVVPDLAAEPAVAAAAQATSLARQAGPPGTATAAVGAAVAGAVALGGGATYLAMRKRAKETDGSELIRDSQAKPGQRRAGTLTAAELAEHSPLIREGKPPQ